MEYCCNQPSRWQKNPPMGVYIQKVQNRWKTCFSFNSHIFINVPSCTLTVSHSFSGNKFRFCDSRSTHGKKKPFSQGGGQQLSCPSNMSAHATAGKHKVVQWVSSNFCTYSVHTCLFHLFECYYTPLCGIYTLFTTDVTYTQK